MRAKRGNLIHILSVIYHLILVQDGKTGTIKNVPKQDLQNNIREKLGNDYILRDCFATLAMGFSANCFDFLVFFQGNCMLTFRAFKKASFFLCVFFKQVIIAAHFAFLVARLAV